MFKITNHIQSKILEYPGVEWHVVLIMQVPLRDTSSGTLGSGVLIMSLRSTSFSS